MVSNEKACGFSKTSFIVSTIKDELIKRCFHQRFHSFASRVQLKTSRDYLLIQLRQQMILKQLVFV
jgi:hypothetical protein